MKKIIVLASFFLFLAAASFGAGAFVAKIKLEKIKAQTAVNKIAESKIIEKNVAPSIENGIEAEKKEFSDNSNMAVGVEKISTKKTSGENDFSFALLGDTQYFKPGTSGSYQTAVNSIKKLNPDLVFAVGDLTSGCDETAECEKKFNAWENVLGPLFARTYVVQGNHDRIGKEKADAVWQKVFKLPINGPEGFSELVYSFDHGNSHFVVLDSDKPKENLVNKAQRNWLENDLTNNKKENVFVFFHEPAYPTNSKIDEGLDVNSKDRDALWDILVKHKVTAVFSGHEHIQARSKIDGIYQFIFGNTQSFNHLASKPGKAEYSYVGEGFGLVEINGKNITVKTYDIGGNLLDSFDLSDGK